MTVVQDVAAPSDAAASLTNAELRRYSRHLLLPEIGLDGQRRLRAAKVLCVGVGGLGSPLALYLAAAGVGTIGLMDFDTVDESNLQRQVLYGTRSIGHPKVACAEARLRDLNPYVDIVRHEERLSAGNAFEVIAAYDVVVDGTDNFPTRYLVNDACVLAGKPNVHGSIFRFEGQLAVFATRDGPCYRCLYPELPPAGLLPNCAEGGVLGVLPGIIGTYQALETIKLLLGLGAPSAGRLFLFDALGLSWQEMQIAKDPACPLCGENRTITELVEMAQRCGVPVGASALPAIDASELQRRARDGERFTLLDVREPHEWAAGNLGELGARLVPLGELERKLETIERGAPIIVHCHSGARSAKAVRRLIDAGFGDVWNLDGGIVAWRNHVASR